MLRQTLQAPPPKGSLQEWALIFLLDRIEDIEHARFRALAQIIIDKEVGVEAFEDYMRIAFPSMQQRKKKRDDVMKDALAAWIGSGPLSMTPMNVPSKGRSKMKQKLVQVEDEKMSRVYKKLSGR